MSDELQTDDLPLWIRVKQATGEASKAAGGDKVMAAVASRITHSARFSEYSNLNQPNRVVPLDAAIETDRHVMSRGGAPHQIALAARELGFLLVPAPVANLSESDIAALCKISKESAEAIAAFADARQDGVTTPDEARRVRREIAEAQTAFAELDARLKLLEAGHE